MIKLDLRILEDELDADLLQDLELEHAWAPEPALAWWRAVLARLQELDVFRSPEINAEMIRKGLVQEEVTISLYLCSRVSLETLSDCDGALGVHLISTPDADPFRDEAGMARAYRCLMVSDRNEFLRLTRSLAEEDVDPAAFLAEYVEAWLNTAFHEIAHALIFAQNAALLPPSEIETLSDAGEIDHDIFDCSTCYGIRPLTIDGEPRWADDMEEAEQMMEIHVEALAKTWLRAVLTDDLSPHRFLIAAGVLDDIDAMIASIKAA